MGRTLLLGLNEINFDYVRRYVERGYLPGFARLLREHGLLHTHAEDRYEWLEPWIQWVTVHTGRSYEEHGVFRLGDIVESEVPQLFEQLEARGLSVGAVSPMNGANRLRNSPYFVPDPWTGTPAAGPLFVRFLARAVSRAVNTNATGGAGATTWLTVLAGLVRFARPRHYPEYARLLGRGLRRHWPRAMLLDRLLFDMHAALYRRHQPDLSVLFLNGGAHIQHHYLFSSQVCEAGRRNPEWYVPPEVDPVLEVYQLYERMVLEWRERFPETRIILVTGLRQVPYPPGPHYYRLVDHADFLQRVGVRDVVEVEPRMSRDFLVRFTSSETAAEAESILRELADEQGRKLFEEVEPRGHELFVTLTYPHEIDRSTRVCPPGGEMVLDLQEHVALVAIKNGHHDATGYCMDTGAAEGEGGGAGIPLKEVYYRVWQSVTG
ncbi:hypothetical protein [Thioalkalivibrio sp. ALE11]|uniref:hypothetical protein n=1 Tax=Thioalkalivibrio sp. ALE11 TaxID=1265494 RepID=UPI00036FE820|nr:hypothetical protein [Thioalkalivibrio sp. ALE11]